MERDGQAVDVRKDAEERIAGEVLCARCGYDLQGLKVEQGCPECGTAVQWSLRGDSLEFREPGWVGRLARGVTFTLVGFAGWLLAGMVGPIGVAEYYVMLVIASVIVTGLWQTTSPDPGRPLGSRYTDPRWLARVLLVAGVWLVCLAFLTRGKSRVLMFVPGTLSFASLAGCQAALLVHLWGLARRIPARRLAQHARMLLWVFVAGAGMRMVGDLAQGIWPNTGLAAGPGSSYWGQWVQGIREISNIVLLVWFVWWVGLQVGYARVLWRAARQARANWADAAA